MIRLFAKANYDFIGYRWKAVWATAVIIIPGLLLLLFRGLKYSIEFTGGTLMQVRFTQAPNIADVRSTLDDSGIKGAEITQFGSDIDYLIRAQDPDPTDPSGTTFGSHCATVALHGSRTGTVSIRRGTVAARRMSGSKPAIATCPVSIPPSAARNCISAASFASFPSPEAPSFQRTRRDVLSRPAVREGCAPRMRARACSTRFARSAALASVAADATSSSRS